MRKIQTENIILKNNIKEKDDKVIKAHKGSVNMLYYPALFTKINE